jgi:hypothetical protein
MIANLVRSDLPVTAMLARSFAEASTVRALGGRDVARLLARGSARLAALREEAEASPCVRRDDGSLDIEVYAAVAAAEVEEAAAAAAAAASASAGGRGVAAAAERASGLGAALFRHAPGIQAFADASSTAIRAHVEMLNALLASGRALASLLPRGRLVVLESVAVPLRAPGVAPSATLGADASSEDALRALAAPAALTLPFVPAVILAPPPETAEGAGAASELTVLVLLPEG